MRLVVAAVFAVLIGYSSYLIATPFVAVGRVSTVVGYVVFLVVAALALGVMFAGNPRTLETVRRGSLVGLLVWLVGFAILWFGGALTPADTAPVGTADAPMPGMVEKDIRTLLLYLGGALVAFFAVGFAVTQQRVRQSTREAMGLPETHGPAQP